jgi:hypothetical protein
MARQLHEGHLQGSIQPDPVSTLQDLDEGAVKFFFPVKRQAARLCPPAPAIGKARPALRVSTKRDGTAARGHGAAGGGYPGGQVLIFLYNHSVDVARLRGLLSLGTNASGTQGWSGPHACRRTRMWGGSPALHGCVPQRSLPRMRTAQPSGTTLTSSPRGGRTVVRRRAASPAWAARGEGGPDGRGRRGPGDGGAWPPGLLPGTGRLPARSPDTALGGGPIGD